MRCSSAVQCVISSAWHGELYLNPVRLVMSFFRAMAQGDKSEPCFCIALVEDRIVPCDLMFRAVSVIRTHASALRAWHVGCPSPPASRALRLHCPTVVKCTHISVTLELNYQRKCGFLVSCHGSAPHSYRYVGGTVYAVDLLSRWRALRGFRKTLEDDHD